MSAARGAAGACWALLVLVLVPAVARGQGVTPRPPGPFVFDIRGTTLGVPQTADFYPDVPGETVVPARSFGLEAGGHVYPVAVGSQRVGLGVDVFVTRATATSPVTTTTIDGVTTTDTPPDVRVTMLLVSPGVSINFGTSRGWSYLTVGAGPASIRSTAGAAARSTSDLAINTGGGARWFLSDHLGVGFDLRIHWLGGDTLFAASAGFSLK